MRVLLDANALVAQHFLKGHLGSALLLALRRVPGKLVMPEVTLAEAKRQALRVAEKHQTSIRTATGELQVLLGSRPAIEWPSTDAIAAKIDAHMLSVNDLVEEMPITVDRVRSAISRVVDGRPPSHNREQYRDALLWEDAKEVARREPLHFVTDDNDFLWSEKSGRSLHPELAEEVKKAGLCLTHHLTLADLLGVIGSEARPDQACLAANLGSAVRAAATEILQSPRFVLQDQRETTTHAFAIPDPNALAVSFDIKFDGLALSGGGVPSANTAVSSGSTLIEITGTATLAAQDLQVRAVELDSLVVNVGGAVERHLVFARATSGPGSSWIPYDFQHRLG